MLSTTALRLKQESIRHSLFGPCRRGYGFGYPCLRWWAQNGAGRSILTSFGCVVLASASDHSG